MTTLTESTSPLAASLVWEAFRDYLTHPPSNHTSRGRGILHPGQRWSLRITPAHLAGYAAHDSCGDGRHRRPDVGVLGAEGQRPRSGEVPGRPPSSAAPAIVNRHDPRLPLGTPQRPPEIAAAHSRRLSRPRGILVALIAGDPTGTFKPEGILMGPPWTSSKGDAFTIIEAGLARSRTSPTSRRSCRAAGLFGSRGVPRPHRDDPKAATVRCRSSSSPERGSALRCNRVPPKPRQCAAFV